MIGGLPADLVDSLTGLTEGRFPVLATATYASDVAKRQHPKRQHAKRQHAKRQHAVKSSARRDAIEIFARPGAPVIAVNDSRIVRVGHSKRLGRYLELQDVYGNVYTYGQLKKRARTYPAAKPSNVTENDIKRELKLDPSSNDPRPTLPASQTTEASTRTRRNPRAAAKRATTRRRSDTPQHARATPRDATKQRLFAHPARPQSRRAGGAQQLLHNSQAGYSDQDSYLTRVLGLDRNDIVLKRLRPGARVNAGTILGRIGRTHSHQAAHLLFEIRPAGRGAPRIDPKPILDGWQLLQTTAIYRAAGKNPFFGPDAKNPSTGQTLLMSKQTLTTEVLADPRIQIYDCGRHDITTGQIDRRVLATLEFLAASGLKPTISALKCGHSHLTTAGNISEHTTGTAVDIAAINDIPILGNQGKDSITDLTIRRLLTLQGTMKPHQIISLMTIPGTDNTLALPDHADHIHIGWRPLYGHNTNLTRHINQILRPTQWIKLIDHLGQIDNPTIGEQPSRHAIETTHRPSSRRGE